MKRVAIIGSGVAGLSAALSLRDRGIPSIILERGGSLGGLCSELGCKGKVRCVRCDVCLARDKIAEVEASPMIEAVRGAELGAITGKPGDFRIVVKKIGAGEGHYVRAGAIICAIGSEPFDPRTDKRLAYGESQDVISSLELDRQLSIEGRAYVPSTRRPPRSVAFIQCVGSRDERFQAGYCSKACCKYSFKLAQALRADDPECQVTFFFMDWRLYDPRENVRLWASTQEGVRLVRSRPAEVSSGEDGRPEVRVAREDDSGVDSLPFELVVLSVGMNPARGSKELARKLGIELDGFGFMRSLPWDPCSSSRPGVFLAGACREPKDIVESVKDGALAANKACAFLEGGR